KDRRHLSLVPPRLTACHMSQTSRSSAHACASSKRRARATASVLSVGAAMFSALERDLRHTLSGMRFELLASLLSSWTDTRTEEERATLHLCREQFTPLVFSHCLRLVKQLISLFQPALLTIPEKPAGGSLFYHQIIPPGSPLCDQKVGTRDSLS